MSEANDSIPFMTLGQVRQRLEESKLLGVEDYYITGGEVFLNPEIIEILAAILEYGPCYILTNGMLLTPKCVEQLVDIQNNGDHDLHFRVSLDSLDEKDNDAIRGENCYRLAMQGIANLSQAGFSTHLTMVRSWDDEEDSVWEEKALAFLRENGVPKPQVKFLPGFLLGELAKNEREYHEHERVTEKCFETFPVTSLQCASSRMATAQGVYVCPILVEEPSAKMGDHGFSVIHRDNARARDDLALTAALLRREPDLEVQLLIQQEGAETARRRRNRIDGIAERNTVVSVEAEVLPAQIRPRGRTRVEAVYHTRIRLCCTV